jgi:hypothetical protein
MFEIIKSLYDQKRLTPQMLDAAVSKKWITTEEKELILSTN